jgi:hypothetical protein
VSAKVDDLRKRKAANRKKKVSKNEFEITSTHQATI